MCDFFYFDCMKLEKIYLSNVLLKIDDWETVNKFMCVSKNCTDAMIHVKISFTTLPKWLYHDKYLTDVEGNTVAMHYCSSLCFMVSDKLPWCMTHEKELKNNNGETMYSMCKNEPIFMNEIWKEAFKREIKIE